jgi:predicted component of type VI protein secretion system
MAILDQVIEMQRGGMSNQEILRNLQEQGVSPSEINDAINQAQIKGAFNETESVSQQMNAPSPNMAPDVNTVPAPGASPAPSPNMAQPEPAPMTPPPISTQPAPAEENYYTQTPQAYDQSYDTGGYGTGTVDPDTVTEIAQQVVEEEFKNYKKKTGDLINFKNTTEEKIDNLDERLKRIENTIDKLQQSIIQQIGEFGENTNYIRKDLENLHNTTSKLMDPLIDNINAMQKHGSHKKTKKKTKKK